MYLASSSSWLAGSLESITNLGRNNKLCFSIQPPIPMSLYGEEKKEEGVRLLLLGG